MDTGKINMLLSELGEVLNLERVTAYDDQMWSLHFAENNSVDVLLVEEKGELLISKNLRIEQEDITLDKLQVLLEYNFLYQGKITKPLALQGLAKGSCCYGSLFSAFF
ncbi:type III secretion system chaperone [Vibrio diabolicus]|uniref:type III secretion system chaperone n=1 Tax=Vibrio diabolicus TaxID=50719 RepID=UPI0037518894